MVHVVFTDLDIADHGSHLKCGWAHRYKGLLCLKGLPPADGENCVLMLHKLGPIRNGSYQLGVSKVSSHA